MKFGFRKQQGFTIVEMLVATILFLILSAVSYRVLRDQGKNQANSVWGTKQNTMSLAALDRFKKDASQIDQQWFEHGVASIYPHQGLGLNENFYTHPAIQSEGLNDGVTFITRDPLSTGLYTLAQKAEYPSTATPGVSGLYNDWLMLSEDSADIHLHDFVLLYEPGKYAIGVVSQINHTTPFQFKLRELDSTEKLSSYLNTSGRNSGYSLKSGVVPASYDWDGVNSYATDDNSISLAANNTKVQVIRPISYELDYATDNGFPHGNGNAFLYDENGNPQKVIVRTQYTGQGIQREYLSSANMLGFTYDVLKSSEGVGLTGFTEGDVVKNVGRGESTGATHFVNLNMDPDAVEGFVSTAKIIAVRMMVGADSHQGQENAQKFNEIKVAINQNAIKDIYQDSGKAVATSSGNIYDRANLGPRQIGQPLYIRYPGSDNVNVVLPVAKLNTSQGGFENGKLVVMNQEGCPVTSNSCSQDSGSEITFSSPTTGPFAGSYFYPSSMTQVSDGVNNTKIMVGGFAIKVDTSTFPVTVTRVPAMAKIELGAGQTLAQALATPATSGSLCSIGNCQLNYFDTSASGTVTGSAANFKDTAGGFSVDGDDMYVASMSKSNNGADGTLSIYKTSVSNPTAFQEISVGTGLAAGRVVTAVSQSPITIDSTKYLPICLTRSIVAMNHPAEDGGIYLQNITNPSAAPIKVADHNFKCTSLQQMNGSLLIGGKLVTSVLNQEEVAAVVRGEKAPSIVYTDEIANFIEETGTKYYADGYYTYANGFSNSSGNMYQSVFGWNTGASVQKISPMQYGVVLGNRSLVMDSHTGSNVDTQDFTTVNINFGGMQERVLASITTNFENLNESSVDAQYGQAEMNLPNGSIIAGLLYYDDRNTPRETLSPLPQIDASMTEAKWFDFYMDLINMQNLSNQAPVTALPDPASNPMFQCGNSRPPTCGI